MLFTNQASLSYNGGTAISNVVSGVFNAPISMTKTASADAYSLGCTLRYTLTIINNSDTPYPGLTVLDDLGRYDWNGFGRFPMAYTDSSATLTLYSASGTTQGSLTVDSETGGMRFGFDLPAGTLALLSYEVYPTSFAPLTAGSVIVNTATLSGAASFLPLSAQHTLPAAVKPELSISKCNATGAVTGQTMSFTFTVANYGNAATQTSDYVILSDQLDPPLTALAVTANGVPWTEGVQYLYEETLAFFQTVNGAIQLPPATFTQDTFGQWNTTPSSLTLTLTGVVSSSSPAQALLEIRPAYTDGQEAFLSVQRQQNDQYLLSGTGAAPAAFMILSRPDSALSLTAASDPRFVLQNGLLTVNTNGLTNPISASIWVDYGAGFPLRVEYVS